jgi:hypothetical protein
MTMTYGTAEIITVSADSTVPPEIELVEVDTVDELIDLARERSGQGKPREVSAVVDGLPVARFMGRWMWQQPG